MRHRADIATISPSPESHYFALPKTVGTVSGELLLDIASQYGDSSHATSPRAAIHNHVIASSAIIEAMLISQDPDHHYDDERITYIDMAASHLQQAAQAKEDLINAGLEPPSAEVALQRLLLNLDFINVYKDMICGEITELTVQELCDALEHHLVHLNRQAADQYADQDVRKNVSGLKGEAAVLLDYWKKRRQGTGLIALPSTRRGGDGNQRPQETHDIILFDEPQPGIFEYKQAREVKAGRALRSNPANLSRYIHPILHVNHMTKQIIEILPE